MEDGRRRCGGETVPELLIDDAATTVAFMMRNRKGLLQLIVVRRVKAHLVVV